MNISEIISNNELLIRLGIFFIVFGIIAITEIIVPRRILTVPKLTRWFNNLGLVVLNSILLRFLFPAAAVGMALFAKDQGWGLLNYYNLPLWFTVLVAVIALDFIIYLQHVMVHAVPVLWRLHRVHHADLDYDVTTSLRFHPLEMILSMMIKIVTVLILGAPVLAVIIFEVLLNATAMFNHGNLRLPKGIDKVLRLIVVTPDMHRVHHSIEEDEANSNFGFNLPWWDRMLGTYRAQPVLGHEKMTIGYREIRDAKTCVSLPGMLNMPFIGKNEITSGDHQPLHGSLYRAKNH